MIVIKIGGNESVDFSLICTDLLSVQEKYKRLILVHGGSSETNALSEKLGHLPKFITSPSGYTSRYTDRPTMEIFLMAINGKVNSLLVEQLQKIGINAIGLSGLDGKLLVAVRKASVQSIEGGKRRIIRDDYTGKIEKVNQDLILTLVNLGYTPVISPIAISPEGEALNVDADRAGAMIAAAVHAEYFVLLTGAPGLLKTFPDEGTLIKSVSQNQLVDSLNYAQGRMKKKILAADEALSGGVKQVIIADGRIEFPVTEALGGGGTWISYGIK